VPDHGLGFGLLRFMNAEIGPSLAALPPPHLGFNYLGRLDASASSASRAWSGWTLVPHMGLGADAEEAMPLAYPLAVTGLTLETPEGPQLTAHWKWASDLIARDEVRELAETWFHVLERLVEYATASNTAGGLTPSDVSLISLSQAEIESLEAIYRSRAARDRPPADP
jgi:non-ribosomal peptide synthase protein (TIGR01720 family)